jgi:hypothetical protein
LVGGVGFSSCLFMLIDSFKKDDDDDDDDDGVKVIVSGAIVFVLDLAVCCIVRTVPIYRRGDTKPIREPINKRTSVVIAAQKHSDDRIRKPAYCTCRLKALTLTLTRHHVNLKWRNAASTYFHVKGYQNFLYVLCFGVRTHMHRHR